MASRNNTNAKSFGSKVNDYLNHYVGVADAKAAGLVTASLTLSGFIYLNKPNYCLPFSLFVALVFYAVCIALSLSVLFPRLNSKGKSKVFWEDVQAHYATPESYYEAVKGLTEEEINKEYSYQNFYVSKILHKKYDLIRWASYAFFVAGAVTFYALVL